MGLLEVLKPVVREFVNEAASNIVSRLDPSRWTVFTTPLCAGPLVGRHLVPYLGVVGVLGLESDGSYRLRVLPVTELPLPVDEAVARAALVEAHRRPASRGHKFSPSPIYPVLCATCAEPALVHDRAVLEEVVRRALGDHFHVRVHFGDGAAVREIEIREPKRGAPWRVLSGVERQRVFLATGVQVGDLAVAVAAGQDSAGSA